MRMSKYGRCGLLSGVERRWLPWGGQATDAEGHHRHRNQGGGDLAMVSLGGRSEPVSAIASHGFAPAVIPTRF